MACKWPMMMLLIVGIISTAAAATPLGPGGTSDGQSPSPPRAPRPYATLSEHPCAGDGGPTVAAAGGVFRQLCSWREGPGAVAAQVYDIPLCFVDIDRLISSPAASNACWIYLQRRGHVDQIYMISRAGVKFALSLPCC